MSGEGVLAVERLPHAPLLYRVGEVAAALGLGAWLVGGVVRDALLGRPSPDLDVVVEGDAHLLARTLASELPGATVRRHPPFGTATLKFPDSAGGGMVTLDLATARTERYAAPAALPEVVAAGLEQDLGRRDFTVNALAASLMPGGVGGIHDPHGGMGDLGKRLLRVLHPGSFRDDPTRISRGVRFEQLLGFRLEPGSEGLARSAVAAGFPARLSGGRVWGELRRLLLLPDPVGAGERMAELGFWGALSLPLPWDGGVRDRLARLPVPHADAEAWESRLMAILLERPWEESRRRMELYHLRRDLGRRLLKDLAILHALRGGWPADEWELYKRVSALSRVGIDLMPVVADPAVAARVLSLWRIARSSPLRVKGADLLQLGLEPGPYFDALLERVHRRAVLHGLTGREAQLAFLARQPGAEGEGGAGERGDG